MKRRDFLHTAAAAGAVSALPAMARAGLAPTPTDTRFVLVRSAEAQPGAQFLPLSDAFCTDCATSAVRVRLDGLHRASAEPVLRELWVSALFDNGLQGHAPFLAWQFVHGAAPRMSQRVAFVAARDSMRGFTIDYRLDAEACSEQCALTSFAAPLLAPGHYALLGPRRDGRRVDVAALRHSGDIAAPLGDAARDFDYLAFRIEALS